MYAVKSCCFRVLAATVGLWMAHTMPVLAQAPLIGPEAATQPPINQPAEPSRLDLSKAQAFQQPATQSHNQQMANTIAGQLRMSGNLKDYTIDIRVENGLVELIGQVASQAQREEAVRVVQGVPGVERVRDNLIVSGPVLPVTATVQPTSTEPRSLQTPPADGAAGPVLGGGAPEPMSIFQGPTGPAGLGGAGVGQMPPPPMPPYAWPTYAPYNNVSRVAYPNLYPYQSWPFIGPMYPYPKVPLGWRSVQLKWQDGHWWYGRTATGHDWWRVRYW
jgi:hypothetical protein